MIDCSFIIIAVWVFIDNPYDNNEINNEKTKSDVEEIEIIDENLDSNNGQYSNININLNGNNNEKKT